MKRKKLLKWIIGSILLIAIIGGAIAYNENVIKPEKKQNNHELVHNKEKENPSKYLKISHSLVQDYGAGSRMFNVIIRNTAEYTAYERIIIKIIYYNKHQEIIYIDQKTLANSICPNSDKDINENVWSDKGIGIGRNKVSSWEIKIIEANSKAFYYGECVVSKKR